MKKRLIAFENFVREIESSEIPKSIEDERETRVRRLSLLENVKRFRFQQKIDDQIFLIFVNQTHHAGREKRKSSDRRSAVSNRIDVRFDVSVLGDVQDVHVH